MPHSYRDKFVLITGAASGLGRTLALRFTEEQAVVVLVDIDLVGLEALSREIDSRGGKCFCYEADVSDAARIAELHDTVTNEHGTPDILVNSAGVAMTSAIDETPLEDWRWLLGVNLWGCIHTIHYFAGDMYERGSGHIVNISSAAGLFGLPFAGLYTTSKHALVGLSRVLRAEASVHGVGVTVVCPGFIRTAMLDNVKTVGMEQDESTSSPIEKISMSPEKVLEKIISAIEKDKALVTCPLYIKVLHGISMFFPRLWDRFCKVFARAGYKARGSVG